VAAGQPGAKHETVGECVLYAKWQKNEYFITLDANGGTGASGTIKAYYNEAYNSLGYTLPTPTRIGHNFAGWLNVETGKIVTATDIVPVAMDHTLRAQWTPCTITLNYNGGTSSVSTITMTSAGTYTGLPATTRTDYLFLGWYYGDTKVTDNMSAVASGNHTLTAKWLKLKHVWNNGLSQSEFVRIYDRTNDYIHLVDPGFDIAALRAAGYTKITYHVWYECYEEDTGYQDTWMRPYNNTGAQIDHWQGEADNKQWEVFFFDMATLDLTDSRISPSGAVYFQWGAHGSVGDDLWRLGKATVTITVS
jgi:uncharacterized repeat protein (TIGR02543 family)